MSETTIEVMTADLLGALKKVLRIKGNDVYSPVLRNVHFRANAESLTITAYNYEIAVSVTIPCFTDGDVSFLVSTKDAELSAFIGDTKTKLVVGGGEVKISSGKRTRTAKTDKVEDYPELPERGTPFINPLSTRELITALEFTIEGAAKEDNRPTLTGVLVKPANERITFAAADGYQLRIAYLDGAIGNAALEHDVIIPATALKLVLSVFDDTHDVYVFAQQNGTLVTKQVYEYSTTYRHTMVTNKEVMEYATYVTFVQGDTVVTIQCIEGKFPDYEAIVPSIFTGQWVVNTAEMLAECLAIAPAAATVANTLRMKQEGDSVKVYAIKEDKSEDSTSVGIVSGVAYNKTTAFNVSMLTAALKAFDKSHGPKKDQWGIAAEQVELLFAGNYEGEQNTSPMVIRSTTNANFVSVLMPMSTGR